MSRLTPSLLALVAGAAAGAEIDPRSLQVPRPTPVSRGRIKRGRAPCDPAWLDEARALTAQLNGNPPGYTYAHRDQLVRKYGARAANMLERRILGRTITFTEALEGTWL